MAFRAQYFDIRWIVSQVRMVCMGFYVVAVEMVIVAATLALPALLYDPSYDDLGLMATASYAAFPIWMILAFWRRMLPSTSGAAVSHQPTSTLSFGKRLIATQADGRYHDFGFCWPNFMGTRDGTRVGFASVMSLEYLERLAARWADQFHLSTGLHMPSSLALGEA